RMDLDTPYTDGVTSLAFSDINGDGFDDIVIGVARGATRGRGSVYVVFGSESGINGPLDLSNLDGTNGFRIEAEGNGNDIGYVVASAGNFNGDAFDDLLITTPSRGDGAAYVIFGSGDGFPATLSLADVASSGGEDGFRIQAEEDSDGLGVAASFAGDFNGDGLDDIIIGAPMAYVDDARRAAGKAYVVFGTDQLISDPLDLSTLNGSNGVRFDALVRSDELGASVAGGGDVNGDGIADVILSAPEADADPDNDRYTNEGRTYVVFGKDVETNGAFDSPFDLSTLDGSNGFTIEAESGTNDLGQYAVSGSGDFNGDGLSDVVTESGNAGDAYFGAAYVVFGAESPVSPDFQLENLASGDGTEALRIPGTAAEDYSMATSLAFGDINGDGLDDLIIGAYQADPDNRDDAGSVIVVFGQASNTSATFDLSDLDGDNGFRVLGASAEDYLGKTLASGGDFNGDGVDDLLIGVPKETNYSFQVYLLYGRETDLKETPQADATPSSLSFPSTEVDQTSETQTITVANPGKAALSIGTLSFTGTHASDFVLSGDTCSGQTVAINSDCTVDVAMTPTGTGTRSASLSIPSNALTSPETVALSGEAFQAGEAVLS
ncbi:MAG TPA: choice-of-anchor D domain-containing protein, partial [Wenzhouxiangella sp.]